MPALANRTRSARRAAHPTARTEQPTPPWPRGERRTFIAGLYLATRGFCKISVTSMFMMR
jgi:hypothetical protein